MRNIISRLDEGSELRLVVRRASPGVVKAPDTAVHDGGPVCPF